jgi:rod shape-determining protein MreB
MEKIYPAVTALISRASSESVAQLLQNIVVTGGGSRIRGFDTVLQQKLIEDGYEAPRVRLAGPDYKRFVAVGALKAARSAREDQWQHLLA